MRRQRGRATTARRRPTGRASYSPRWTKKFGCPADAASGVSEMRRRSASAASYTIPGGGCSRSADALSDPDAVRGARVARIGSVSSTSRLSRRPSTATPSTSTVVSRDRSSAWVSGVSTSVTITASSDCSSATSAMAFWATVRTSAATSLEACATGTGTSHAVAMIAVRMWRNFGIISSFGRMKSQLEASSGAPQREGGGARRCRWPRAASGGT